MKQYGSNFATEFTKKQISVIYSKAKSGELNVEKWFMSELYELADYYGHDYNRSVARQEANVKEIFDSVFGGKTEEAQKLIDSCANNWFSKFSFKNQNKCDRNVFVK